MQKMDVSNNKFTPINYKAEMKIDLAKERQFMFDYVCREEKNVLRSKHARCGLGTFDAALS